MTKPFSPFFMGRSALLRALGALILLFFAKRIVRLKTIINNFLFLMKILPNISAIF